MQDSLYTAGRRGVGGTVLIEKIVGALAELGAPLEEVKEVCEKVNAQVRSMGMALTSCAVPAAGKPTFDLGEDEFELGIGIHGEPGISEEDVLPAKELAAMLVKRLLSEKPAQTSGRVAVVLNGLGCTKYEELPKNLEWHLIGHLQRNKVKYIADKAALIHSVDSLRLAETINHEGEKIQRVIPVLIEVNVAQEETKFGVSVEETMSLIEEICKLPYVQIQGLMTIAPYVPNPEENRPVFRKLKQLSVDISSKNMNNVHMDILSMGMTNDYQVAVEEGATMVRVGTGIFGERDYSKTK